MIRIKHLSCSKHGSDFHPLQSQITIESPAPGGGAAHRKSGVACLRTFRCGMGGLKFEHYVDVCAHKKGVKMKDFLKKCVEWVRFKAKHPHN